MLENSMQYKSYTAEVQYSVEDGCYIGRVVGVRDIISFEGGSIADLEVDFHNAIDFHLQASLEQGKAPG